MGKVQNGNLLTVSLNILNRQRMEEWTELIIFTFIMACHT